MAHLGGTRFIRRHIDAEGLSEAADQIPSAMEGPLFGDLRLTLNLLDHRFMTHHQLRVRAVDMDKACMVNKRYLASCVQCLEQMARQEGKGIPQQFNQVWPACTEQC